MLKEIHYPMKFTAADVHCLNAAEGWLELGIVWRQTRKAKE